jgi:hypothetical protein
MGVDLLDDEVEANGRSSSLSDRFSFSPLVHIRYRRRWKSSPSDHAKSAARAGRYLDREVQVDGTTFKTECRAEEVDCPGGVNVAEIGDDFMVHGTIPSHS